MVYWTNVVFAMDQVRFTNAAALRLKRAIAIAMAINLTHLAYVVVLALRTPMAMVFVTMLKSPVARTPSPETMTMQPL